MHTIKRLLLVLALSAVLPFSAQAVSVSSTAVDHIVVQPNDRPTIVDQNTDLQFLATAFSAANEEISAVTFSWVVSGDVGTITSSGIFTGTRGGIGQVIAKTGNVTASIGVVVRAVAGAKPPANTNTPAPAITTNINTPAIPSATVTEPVVEATLETPSITEATTPSATTCTTLRNWVWVVVVLGQALLLFVYFLTLGDSRTLWWWVWPLLSTAGLITLHDALRCGGFNTWIPWSVATVGILIAVFYLRALRPKEAAHLA